MILDELEHTGTDKNTIIVFNFDNGHSLSDQELIHKQSVYESDIHDLSADPQQTERVAQMIKMARQAGHDSGENLTGSPFWRKFDGN